MLLRNKYDDLCHIKGIIKSKLNCLKYVFIEMFLNFHTFSACSIEHASLLQRPPTMQEYPGNS